MECGRCKVKMIEKIKIIKEERKREKTLTCPKCKIKLVSKE